MSVTNYETSERNETRLTVGKKLRLVDATCVPPTSFASKRIRIFGLLICELTFLQAACFFGVYLGGPLVREQKKKWGACESRFINAD
jgi:hypothetical protein